MTADRAPAMPASTRMPTGEVCNDPRCCGVETDDIEHSRVARVGDRETARDHADDDEHDSDGFDDDAGDSDYA